MLIPIALLEHFFIIILMFRPLPNISDFSCALRTIRPVLPTELSHYQNLALSVDALKSFADVPLSDAIDMDDFISLQSRSDSGLAIISDEVSHV